MKSFNGPARAERKVTNLVYKEKRWRLAVVPNTQGDGQNNCTMQNGRRHVPDGPRGRQQPLQHRSSPGKTRQRRLRRSGTGHSTRLERSEPDNASVGTQQASLNSACIVHGALQNLNDTARACLLDILNRRLGRKNFSVVKYLSLNEERRRDSFLFVGERRRILVVASIGKRESLLSVWDRGDPFVFGARAYN